MGFWLAHRFPLRALDKPEHHRARRWIERYGALVLLLAWLPVVGDPLCFVAGWLRVNLLASLLTITLGKALRYAVIIGMFS
jgi:membrane protein YqaA with SNARE-associated domain